MTATRASIIVVACTAAAVAASQVPPPSQPLTFRVAVDIVSIDAVVTDRKGEIVRDLTAADFEILQDGKPQKVTFAQFVPVTAAPAAAATGSGALPAGAAPPSSAPITREQVRRTFLIVVDDLGLSLEGINNIRKGLRGFIDTALLPTDLVVLVRTGEARSLLQPLTNDREALRAAIDALRYNALSRKSVSPILDVSQGLHGPEVEEAVSGVQRAASIAGTMAALNLAVQAARDVPGRKTVILASEGFALNLPPGEAMRFPGKDDNSRVRSDADTVIDQATRSGVVIYSLNGAGLLAGGPRASDDLHQTAAARDPFASGEQRAGDAMAGAVRGLAGDRQRDIGAAQQGLEYLAERTGGFAVSTNDFAGGFARISHDVRDYYLIGYEPDHNTFALKDKSPRLHTIVVNVRRAGVRVRTRKEFIGVSDPTQPSGPPTPAQQLVRAARSPFSATTIAMHGTNLPGYAPGRGLFVRTVLYLDAGALALSSDANGTRTATVDLVGLVINGDGVQVETIATGFNVTLQNAAAEQAMKDGLVYTARVLIKKPGGYQLRYAVRDRRSGAVGSAGGFVNVPDVTGGVFALSGLVLRAGEQTVARESIDSDRFSLPPADALRVYAPGTQLSYAYEVYNAGRSVQTVASLWRGTDRLTSQPPDTLVPPARGGHVVAAGRLKLADDLPAGTYVLQIAATSDDPKQAKKTRTAVQRISFDVK
ncbi:MAG: VWA domain-containing protein [Actinomycetota bacterium]|nr:VWA domain-containing protein [Actinomycetota bacterium]